MRVSLGGAIAFAIAGAVGPTAAAQTVRLEEFVREAEALGARVGCVVLGRAGELLAAHRADEWFTPASNQKLLTAIAALRGLGSDFRFETAFVLEDGVLRIHGGGDPNLAEGGEHAPSVLFDALAAKLRDLGVRAVRAVEPVEGAFTGQRRPSGWPQDQLHLSYCAPTGALVLEAGCFRARVRADAEHGRAWVDRVVPSGLPLRGDVGLASRGRQATPSLWVDGDELVVSGSIAAGAPPREFEGTVGDPAAVFRRCVEAALARGGVGVDPEAPPRNERLGVHRSTLAEALRPMLVESSNFHAEQVLRSLGAALLDDGSFAGGTRAVRGQLAELLEALPADCIVADGSGLSRENRVSPRVLARALLAATREPWGELLLDSLARPGEGTLRHRFTAAADDLRLRAKSGWIRGASALSGYAGDRVFAILMNYAADREGLNRRLKRLQESMVQAALGASRQ